MSKHCYFRSFGGCVNQLVDKVGAAVLRSSTEHANPCKWIIYYSKMCKFAQEGREVGLAGRLLTPKAEVFVFYFLCIE